MPRSGPGAGRKVLNSPPWGLAAAPCKVGSHPHPVYSHAEGAIKILIAGATAQLAFRPHRPVRQGMMMTAWKGGGDADRRRRRATGGVGWGTHPGTTYAVWVTPLTLIIVIVTVIAIAIAMEIVIVIVIAIAIATAIAIGIGIVQWGT